MHLITSREAMTAVNAVHHGAYDFEKFLDYDGITAGWSYRTQSRDFGFVLTDGTVGQEVAPYRWWAEDMAFTWLRA